MDTIPSLRDELNSLDFSNSFNYGKIYDLYKRLANGYRIISKYLPDERFQKNSELRTEAFDKAAECHSKELEYRSLWLESKKPL